jgi:MFS family permease
MLRPDREAEPRDGSIVLGVRANWQQFTLLVVVNAFVGAMVGLERSVLPVVASSEFRIRSATAILSFIATFGVSKALTNLAAGWLADRGARRAVLLVGWLVALPIPLLVLWSRSWWWIVGANALLGVNQGLTWSMTVVMKIDLAGPRRRGLAMGLNEFAGYAAVAGAGILSGVAATYLGLRGGAAYPGLTIAVAGLLLSVRVRDSSEHARLEASERHHVDGHEPPALIAILRRSLWSDAGLFSLGQAGLINNLNDALAWGLFPLLFVRSGLTVRAMSVLVAVYPGAWSCAQLAAGPLSDRWGRKRPIVTGMSLQAIALLAIPELRGFSHWAIALGLLGVGTALVYPTLLAAIGDLAHPSWRGAAVGVYRLWRDLGYVFGALFAGILTDAFRPAVAIQFIGVLTFASGLVVAIRLRDRRESNANALSGGSRRRRTAPSV